MSDNLPAVRESDNLPAVRHELSVEDVVEQVRKIQHVMEAVMDKDVHYGVIPGTGTKPTLLKPGAEKLMLTFRLRPEFRRDVEREGDHLTVTSYCSLYHIPTGDCFARDVAGICSSRESKYGYRKSQRECPACGAPALKKNKDGKTWQCMEFLGGCWEKFLVDDTRVTDQDTGRVVNPDLPDQWNTIIKMADKRALIAATLIGTGASDFFTQDLEDLSAAVSSETPPSSEPTEKPAPSKRRDKAAAASDAGEEPSDSPSSARITAEQQRELIAAAKEKGMAEAALNEAVERATGKTKRASLTSDELPAVLEEIASWGEVVEGEATDDEALGEDG